MGQFVDIGGSGGGAAADPIVVSPAQLTGDVNDYAPSGLATADVLRIDTTVDASITGLSAAGRTDGRLLVILNVSTKILTLPHESSSSSAANRHTLPGGTAVQIDPAASATLVYDTTSTRWRQMSGRDQLTADLASLE